MSACFHNHFINQRATMIKLIACNRHKSISVPRTLKYKLSKPACTISPRATNTLPFDGLARIGACQVSMTSLFTHLIDRDDSIAIAIEPFDQKLVKIFQYYTYMVSRS